MEGRLTVEFTTNISQDILDTATHAPNRTRAMTSYPLAEYQLIWTPEVVFRVTTIIVVMVFTFIGNSSLIIGIVCHRKLRRKRVNIFLINLAIGDLMVCLVTMTTEILFVAFGEWVLGAAACKIIVYGQIVTLASATFLLTAMSIDRYQVIVQPFKSLAGKPKIWIKVITAWGLAFIFAIPQLLIFVQTNEGVYPDGQIKHMCKSKGYTAQWQRKLSFTLMTVYILVIPTVIMSFCYINIIKVVWMRTSAHETRPPKFRFVSTLKSRDVGERLSSVTSHRTGSMDGHSLSLPPRLVSNSKRNVIKMTLSVIIGFVMCWSPYFVVGLIRIYSDYRIKMRQAFSVTEIMALIHSALNPILYGIFNTHMARRACKNICMKWCSRDTIVVQELNVSDEDSTYWSDTKVQHVSVTRMSIAQPMSNCHIGRGSDSRLNVICGRLKSFFCCEPPSLNSHSKPLLIYRRAESIGYVASECRQYESFRMRAQSTGGYDMHMRNSSQESHIPERSSAQPSLPSTSVIPIRAVSESNITLSRHTDITNCSPETSQCHVIKDITNHSPEISPGHVTISNYSPEIRPETRPTDLQSEIRDTPIVATETDINYVGEEDFESPVRTNVDSQGETG